MSTGEPPCIPFPLGVILSALDLPLAIIAASSSPICSMPCLWCVHIVLPVHSGGGLLSEATKLEDVAHDGLTRDDAEAKHRAEAAEEGKEFEVGGGEGKLQEALALFLYPTSCPYPAPSSSEYLSQKKLRDTA